jgi:hypothetical protein
MARNGRSNRPNRRGDDVIESVEKSNKGGSKKQSPQQKLGLRLENEIKELLK